MPVETRSRTHVGSEDGLKEKKDPVITRTPRKKRGRQDAVSSGEETSAVKVRKSASSSSKSPEELVKCGQATAPVLTAEPPMVTPTIVNSPRKLDSVKTELPSKSSGDQKREEGSRVKSGQCLDARTDVKKDREIESASVPAMEIGEIIQHVKEAYKKETCARNQIKGKPKSGRIWKTEQTARFSDLRKDKPLKSSWERKMAQKAEKLSVRKFQQDLQDAKRQEIELKKQRRAEHQKRKEENQKKSEVVQEIRNTAKLKRMKKKQLRRIEKR